MIDALRLTEHIHGHLGWLAAAALVHPAILLRDAKRRAAWSVALSLAIVTLAGALGARLYTPYRDTLKQAIFLRAPSVGYLFERKEHLAFGAIALAWAGAIAYFAGRASKDETATVLRRVAASAYLAAALFALATAALGTYVATYKTF
jgi:hypothetical protein